MSLTFLLIIVLTGAITFFVLVASFILVLHKSSARRMQAIHKRLKEYYAHFVTGFLMADIPPREPGMPASRHFRRYEELLKGMKRKHGRMAKGKRAMHRAALRDVVVEFAKDLSGEAGERLVFISYSFEFVEELIHDLNNRKWWVRAHAARNLGLLGAKRAIAGLTAALEDPHPDVRFEAIQALVRLAGVTAFRSIFRLGKNFTTWHMMALSVTVLGFREDAVPYLLEGLEARDASVVVFCIEMLAEIGFTSAVDPLRQVAEKYPNVTVRAKAMEALGRLGDARAVPMLVENTSNTYPTVRLSALNALRRVGTPSAVPRLLERVKLGTLEERIAAARALVRSGERGRGELRKLLAAPDPMLSQVAAQVLEELEGGEVQADA